MSYWQKNTTLHQIATYTTIPLLLMGLIAGFLSVRWNDAQFDLDIKLLAGLINSAITLAILLAPYLIFYYVGLLLEIWDRIKKQELLEPTILVPQLILILLANALIYFITQPLINATKYEIAILSDLGGLVNPLTGTIIITLKIIAIITFGITNQVIGRNY